MSVRRKSRSACFAFIEALESRQLLSVAVSDLTPSITRSTIPASVVGGSKVHGTVKVSLTNATAAPAKGASVQLFLSTDGLVDSSATALGSPSHAVTVKNGHSSSVSLSIHALPASLQNGTYAILAQVTDPSGTAVSSVGPSIVVAAPFVSLSASSYVVKPATLVPGKGVTLSVVLANAGNIATTGSASFNIGVSTDDQTESKNITTLSKPVHIKPGGHTTVRVHLKVPGSVPAGQFFPFLSVTEDGSTTTALAAEITID